MSENVVQKRSWNPTGLLTFQTRTTNHLGTGVPEGVIDRPIFREHATRLPAWPGSSLKGALRAAMKPKDSKNSAHAAAWLDLFGPEASSSRAGEMGMLHIEDAHLVALPVPTPAAGIAWVSSPFLLRRLQVEATAAGLQLASGLPIPDLNANDCAASQEFVLTGEQRLRLGDLALTPSGVAGLETSRAAWGHVLADFGGDGLPAWKNLLAQSLVIVSDVAMRHLAHQLELRARIAFSEDGKDPNLWFDELLPEFSLLWARFSVQPSGAATHFGSGTDLAVQTLLGKSRAGESLLPALRLPAQILIGGGASVGRGRVGLSVRHQALESEPAE